MLHMYMSMEGYNVVLANCEVVGLEWGEESELLEYIGKEGKKLMCFPVKVADKVEPKESF